MDAPDLLYLEDDEERKSDEDDTRRFTIKDFKEKAQKFAKDNFDKYAAKKKTKGKVGLDAIKWVIIKDLETTNLNC